MLIMNKLNNILKQDPKNGCVVVAKLLDGAILLTQKMRQLLILAKASLNDFYDKFKNLKNINTLQQESIALGALICKVGYLYEAYFSDRILTSVPLTNTFKSAFSEMLLPLFSSIKDIINHEDIIVLCNQEIAERCMKNFENAKLVVSEFQTFQVAFSKFTNFKLFSE